jgi:hypothetical protein
VPCLVILEQSAPGRLLLSKVSIMSFVISVDVPPLCVTVNDSTTSQVGTYGRVIHRRLILGAVLVIPVDCGGRTGYIGSKLEVNSPNV